MHEMAVTQSILDIAVSEAEKHGATRVKEIKIKVGAYSGIVPQLIQEYYNLISAGTIAEQAKLIIDRVPVTVRCKTCGQVSEIEKNKYACPVCESIEIQLLTGREFYVDSLEVD